MLIKIEQIAGFKAEFLQKLFFPLIWEVQGKVILLLPVEGCLCGACCPQFLTVSGVGAALWELRLAQSFWLGKTLTPGPVCGVLSTTRGPHPHPAPWERKAGSGQGHSVVNNPRWTRRSRRFHLPKHWDSLGTLISQTI